MSETSTTQEPLAEIRQQQNGYLAIFAVLVIGTIATVAMYYVHFEETWQTVSIALTIAGLKAICVAAIFMHLWHGQRLVFAVLAYTGICAVAMLGFLAYSLSSLPELTQFWR